MKIKGVSEDQIRSIATSLGFRLDNPRRKGNYFLFVLRMATPIGRGGWRKALPEALRYRKRGYSAHYRGSDAFGGNGAVCFHGHKRFMEKIFAINPEAQIRTKMADYLGVESFRAQFPRVGSQNVGSMMYPMRYDEACECDPDEEHEVTFGTLTKEKGLTNVRTIRQSAIGRCPFVIFSAEHYREDGTCKCNDPAEREMMKREWEYTDEAFRERGIIP